MGFARQDIIDVVVGEEDSFELLVIVRLITFQP